MSKKRLWLIFGYFIEFSGLFLYVLGIPEFLKQITSAQVPVAPITLLQVLLGTALIVIGTLVRK